MLSLCGAGPPGLLACLPSRLSLHEFLSLWARAGQAQGWARDFISDPICPALPSCRTSQLKSEVEEKGIGIHI